MGVIDTIKNIGRNVAALGGTVQGSGNVAVNTPQQRVSNVQRFMERPGFITRKKSGKKGGIRYTVGGGISYRATQSKGVSVKSPGRPRQSYKLRPDPITGRLVRMPATVLYKRARLAKRMASAGYQRRQMEKAQFYQQRGIPPQQAAQIEMIRQQRIAQQLAMQQQMAQQPQQTTQIQQIPIRQRYYRPTPQFPMEQQRQATIKPDFFRGGTVVAPKERWLE